MQESPLLIGNWEAKNWGTGEGQRGRRAVQSHGTALGEAGPDPVPLSCGIQGAYSGYPMAKVRGQKLRGSRGVKILARGQPVLG